MLLISHSKWSKHFQEKTHIIIDTYYYRLLSIIDGDYKLILIAVDGI